MEYVFTTQTAIHTIKGGILFRIMALFQVSLFILYQAPHSRPLAPACDILVINSLAKNHPNQIALMFLHFRLIQQGTQSTEKWKKGTVIMKNTFLSHVIYVDLHEDKPCEKGN